MEAIVPFGDITLSARKLYTTGRNYRVCREAIVPFGDITGTVPLGDIGKPGR